jgi:hypothetical protein
MAARTVRTGSPAAQAHAAGLLPGVVVCGRYASGSGRWVLVTVLGSAMASIDATVVGIALPATGRDFGAGLTTLPWILTAHPPAGMRWGITCLDGVDS